MAKVNYTDNDLTPENILKVRKATGKSQEGFGDALGVSNVTVNRWENGKSRPRSKNVKRALVNAMNKYLTEGT